jgi:hypothetical protein
MSDMITEKSGSILCVELNRPDAREAFTASVEKRPPHFTGAQRAGSHR